MTLDKTHNHKSSDLNQSLEEFISFSDLLLIIARQIKTILIIPIIMSFLSILYIFFLANPVYISSSKIVSSSSGSNLGQAAGFAAQLGINLPVGQSEQNWVYPEIIKSRSLQKSC